MVVVRFSLECRDVIGVAFLHYAFGLKCSCHLELKTKLNLLKLKPKPIEIARAAFLRFASGTDFLPRVLIASLD